MKKKLCLITGASAGIGERFAIKMAQLGYDLAIVARREARLITLAQKLEKEWGAKSIIIPQDMHQINAVNNILEKIQNEGRDIDYLINNAGYGLPGTFETTKWQEQADFLQIMLHAPTELIHKTAPLMKKRGFGRIINVASLAGLIPGTAGHTLYSAVKSYLIKTSQSLNCEYDGTGVNISALCPGFTYSEFHDVNGTRELMAKMPKFMWLEAEQVVNEAIKGVEVNKAIVITGTINKIIATIAHILPDELALLIVKKYSKNFRNI